MSHPNKVKGCGFEREVVKLAEKKGLTAERTWGSDGRSRGLAKEVDVLVSHDGQEIHYLQCKRAKKISKLYKPMEGIYGQVFREDRMEPMIMIRLDDYFNLLKNQ